MTYELPPWMNQMKSRCNFVRSDSTSSRSSSDPFTIADCPATIAKSYRYMRPGLETTSWKTLETGVIDPFGNAIHFCEPITQ